MTVRVIIPPDPVVSLDDAKKHLRVDTADDDDYIKALIDAAISWIDGPNGWLGRALGLQTLELVSDTFPCGSDLPYAPIVDIVSVNYVDANGTASTLADDRYELVESEIRPVFGTSWPTLRRQSDAVRIRYRAGYGSFSDTDPAVWTAALPRNIWAAILMLVHQWFQNRDSISIGATVEQLPFAVDALLSVSRIYR